VEHVTSGARRSRGLSDIAPQYVAKVRYFTMFCELHINPLELSGYCMYHMLWHARTLHAAYRVRLCVSYVSRNKQLLSP
jgi:hypothetical protein